MTKLKIPSLVKIISNDFFSDIIKDILDIDIIKDILDKIEKLLVK